MQNVLAIADEVNRLKALLSYQILDTPNEIEFDDIVNIVARIYNVPAAAVSFIDENRQWIKASIGLQVCETSRKDAVCNYTIRENSINEIEDMRSDKRFRNFPFVAGDPFFRFYAGIPLITENDYAIGALCILDTTVRTLNEEEKNLLSKLGPVVMTQVEISLRRKELERIKYLQQRVISLASSREQNTATLTLFNENNHLQPEHTDIPYIIEDLVAMNELLEKQAGYITKLLNERIEWRKTELQNAIGEIKSEQLKQLVALAIDSSKASLC